MLNALREKQRKAAELKSPASDTPDGTADEPANVDPIPTEQHVDDCGFELAYVAGEKQLAAQTASLENLRARANNILAAITLFVWFTAALGILNTDPDKGKVLHPLVTCLCCGQPLSLP